MIVGVEEVAPAIGFQGPVADAEEYHCKLPVDGATVNEFTEPTIVVFVPEITPAKGGVVQTAVYIFKLSIPISSFP